MLIRVPILIYMLYNIFWELEEQHKKIWKIEFYIIAKTEYLKTDIESAQSSVLNFLTSTVLVCFHFWFGN